MSKKILLIFCLTILICCGAKAQNVSSAFKKNAISKGPPRKSNTQAHTLIYARITAYTDSLFKHTTAFNSCVKGYAFVRFAVDKKGRPIEVITNNNTPRVIDSALKQALKRTNGLWQPTALGVSFLLPVQYIFKQGCAVDTSSKKYSALEWKLKEVGELTDSNQSNPDNDFLNMINFGAENSGKAQPINCILLPPFQLVNPIISGHPY